MIEYKGIYFPYDEQHLIHWMETVAKRADADIVGPFVDGKPTYQYQKYSAALKYCKSDRRLVAFDIGSHIGLWTRVMALDFGKVLAFEPVRRHRECWAKNLEKEIRSLKVQLFPIALGEKSGDVRLVTRTENSSGDTGIASVRNDIASVKSENCAHSCWGRMEVLDEIRDRLGKPDFIKIDNEGYEYFVIRGGEKLIRESKPVMIVEQKPGMGARYDLDDIAAVKLLESWGAKRREEINGDYILSWD